MVAEKRKSAPERIEKSPQKEVKTKKSTFSKLKSYVTGAPQKAPSEESYKLLRQQNTEFLDDMRKHHDEQKEAVAKYNIVWLSEKKPKTDTEQTPPSKTIVMTEKERAALKLIRQNTDSFLKDHQEYHNKQRTEDNGFFAKVGKPEHLLWLSSSPKTKKDTIITKVKKLMSPQQSKKTLIENNEIKNKIIRDQTDEFIRKHMYLIHKEELDFKKVPIQKPIVTEKVTVMVAEKQKSAPERIEKSPQKEVKTKKSTFSKLKSYVTGAPQKAPSEESYKLLRQQNTEFLDDMRKHHDEHKEAVTKYNIAWLSEKKPKNDIDQTQPSKLIILTEKEKAGLKLIRQNTDNFFMDHQDYHNKQRTEDNGFFGKVGKPDHVLWLSSNKTKKDTVSKIKELIPAQESKKAFIEADEVKNKLMRDQTDKFLRKLESTKIVETPPSKAIIMSDKDNATLKLERLSTDKFLKNHQEYHHRQRAEDNDFFEKNGKTKNFLWLSSRSVLPIIVTSEQKAAPTPRKNIVSKVKNILSPTKTVGTTIFYYGFDDTTNEINLKNKSDESTNSQHVVDDSIAQSVASNSSQIVECGKSDQPPQQMPKKKVTFSTIPSNSDTEFNTFDEQEMKEPIEEIYHDCLQGPENLASSIPLETKKPTVVPRKQIAKKVKTIFIDSAEIFKLDKELYLIRETSKFLEDHKNHQKSQWGKYQNTDRGAVKETLYPEEKLPKDSESEGNGAMERVISPLSSPHQKTSFKIPVETDDIRPKEPKLTSKLMSKIKSLVGGSQENISVDKKRDIETALVRKQTLEFLISQKCYNDLEGDASHKFHLKQLNKLKFVSENIPNRSQFVLTSSENSKKDLNLVYEEDSTFCCPRKSPVNGSPEYYIIKSQEPQKSSLDKKISKTADMKIKEKADSEIENKIVKHKEKFPEFFKSIEQNKEFLNGQRDYITSENRIWNHYLKYKPEAASSKKLVRQKECVQNIAYIQAQNISLPKAIKRTSSSQSDNDRIDHEVILHKTKLFLEDHKTYHDNLHEALYTYIPEQAKGTVVDGKFDGKREGVLTKIRSLLPSGPLKHRSYDIQKAENSHSEDGKNSANLQSIHLDTSETTPPTIKSEMELKKLTTLFLKDHQDYHDSERSYIFNYKWKADERQKKSKKGVISKIKSLVTGDHKKTSAKKITNASEEVDSKSLNEKRDDVFIRELESSPTTFRKQPRTVERKKQETISMIQNINLEKSSIVGYTKPISHESETTLHSEFKPPSVEEDIEQKKFRDTGARYETSDDNVILVKKLSYEQIKMLPEDERKKFAISKIKTQEFLLNQKQFSDTDREQNSKGSKNIESSKYSENSGERKPSREISNVTDTLLLTSEQESHETGKDISGNENKNQTVQKRNEHLPSAPSLEDCEELSEREKEKIQSVVHRMVKPLSPTKTIFKEIRKREDSPDRKVYIMKEGYMITKENREGSTKDDVQKRRGERNEHITTSGKAAIVETKKKQYSTGDGNSKKQEEECSTHSLSYIEGLVSVNTKNFTGQDYVDRSDDSPRAVPRSDLEVRRHNTKKRTFGDMEKGPAKVVTETRIERGSNGEEKYITTCFLNKVPTPVWYTESLLLDLEEKTKKTDVKVYYDDLYQAYRWEESFKTKLSSRKDNFKSEVTIPVTVESEEIHFISLEHQQQPETAS